MCARARLLPRRAGLLRRRSVCGAGRTCVAAPPAASSARLWCGASLCCAACWPCDGCRRGHGGRPRRLGTPRARPAWTATVTSSCGAAAAASARSRFGAAAAASATNSCGAAAAASATKSCGAAAALTCVGATGRAGVGPLCPGPERGGTRGRTAAVPRVRSPGAPPYVWLCGGWRPHEVPGSCPAALLCSDSSRRRCDPTGQVAVCRCGWGVGTWCLRSSHRAVAIFRAANGHTTYALHNQFEHEGRQGPSAFRGARVGTLGAARKYKSL